MYHLTDEAANDIAQVLEASLERFGTARTDRYVQSLKPCFGLLALNPELGTELDIGARLSPLSARTPHHLLPINRRRRNSDCPCAAWA